MKLLIASIFLFTQISYANCEKPVTYLKEGQSAPCLGYLFTAEKEKEVRADSLKLQTQTELVTKQDELINVLNQRVYIAGVTNENLRSNVSSLESKNKLDQIIYFTLGLVVGLGIGKALTK